MQYFFRKQIRILVNTGSACLSNNTGFDVTKLNFNENYHSTSRELAFENTKHGT